MLNHSPSSEFSRTAGQEPEAISRIDVLDVATDMIDQALPEQVMRDKRDRTMIDDALREAMIHKSNLSDSEDVPSQPPTDLTVESAQQLVEQSLEDTQGYIDV